MCSWLCYRLQDMQYQLYIYHETRNCLKNELYFYMNDLWSRVVVVVYVSQRYRCFIFHVVDFRYF